MVAGRRLRLRLGGVYAQLLWGPDLPMLAGGLRQVFPEVVLYPTGYQDSFSAVALTESVPGPAPLKADRLSPAALGALRQLGVADPRALLPTPPSVGFVSTPAITDRRGSGLPTPLVGFVFDPIFN